MEDKDKPCYAEYGLKIPDRLPTCEVIAGPVVDVISVTLQPKNSSLICDGKRWEIYGEIEMKDGTGSRRHIFYQDKEDPEIVDQKNSPDGLLSVTLSEPVVTPFPVSVVKMRLMDRVRNLELVNDTFGMDFQENCSYETVKISKHVEGNDGSGDVRFYIFPAAAVAKVLKFEVTKLDDSSKAKSEESNDGRDLDRDMDVYGSITAILKTNYGESFSTTIFNLQRDNAIKVKSGTPIKPPRSLVAVPAYASLVIQSCLCDVDFDDAEFTTCDVGYHFIKIESNSFIFKVTVRWDPAYPEKKIASSKGYSVSRGLLAKQIFRPQWKWRNFHSDTMMEIFSTFFLSNKDDAVKLYGFIDVMYSGNHHQIIQWKETDKFLCSKKVTCLEMDGPHDRSFAGTYLCTTVNLTDDRDRIFCYGHFFWDVNCLESPFSWYNRRICGIIPCESGFFAIHYAVFNTAVEAKLKVVLSCNESSSGVVTSNVTGTIVAEYSNMDYSTSYKRECYRSVLFSKPVLCDSNTPLRLSKSVVAVPIGLSLIIGLDLCVTPENRDSSDQVLKDVAKFYIGSRSQWEIRGGDYSITVAIEWSW